MNSLEWSRLFSHNKSMRIFRFGQGQLTLQPLVRSASNSNSVQTLWLSSLPERMKKIRPKNEGTRVATRSNVDFL